MRQRQFLDVVDEATAHARFDAACAHLGPRVEEIVLADALGRVIAEDVRATVDVPGFDRSNVDGFAVRAADTFGASELEPLRLRRARVDLAAGRTAPEGFHLGEGEAAPIATGGVLPRGADAVVMVEHTLADDDVLAVSRAVAPGDAVTFAGTDIGRGEIVQRAGTVLTSRETGMLAAVGVARVSVHRRPRVAVLSTGDEIRAPGETLPVGHVYDSNARILADAVRECGGEPLERGIVADDTERLTDALRALLAGPADVVLLSGGTSKGPGDLNYRVVASLADESPGSPHSPGIVVHGVALKPGKPICLAVVEGKSVVILPGFPTSAVFTFHEFVAPLIRRLAGRRDESHGCIEAIAPLRITSVEGRTQYTLVSLVPSAAGLAAYPAGAGSGSVSAFSRADGFVRIPDSVSYVDAGSRVEVRLLGRDVRPADVVAIGSHCVGLDWLLGELGRAGFRTKSIAVGSTAGLAALARGEGDVAGVHLLHPETGEYNRPFLPDGVTVLGGYGRRQGLVFRKDDERFSGVADPADFLRAARNAGARMVNRNAGSGTRVLLDELLGDLRPDGYHAQARSHHAVAAAVAQGRADWGVTLDVLARDSDLGFLPLREERYDIVARDDRLDRPAVAALRTLLESDAAAGLRRLGFVCSD